MYCALNIDMPLITRFIYDKLMIIYVKSLIQCAALKNSLTPPPYILRNIKCGRCFVEKIFSFV